jgi:hypothetical protein
MRKICFLSLLVIFACSCRDEYDARVNSMNESFLVVEANLNAGADSTIIRLTRTLKLEDIAKIKAENGALLTVEGKDNTSRTLTGLGNGYYASANLGLIINNEYRLRIHTSDGKEFLSSYVKAKRTPLIDSISWEMDDRGLTVYANTHDPGDTTRYYRWDYDETWEIRSLFYSYYVYDNAIAGIRPRNLPAEQVYYCWRYDTSSTIPLANSLNLQNDIIYKAPLKLINYGDDRLSVRYSIQVRQYALEKEAYDFFELMKKNTEEIGSIFSPQPSELKGNITCITDPKEYVLGYVTSSTVEEQRKFIQVPWDFRLNNCHLDTTGVNDRDKIRAYYGSGAYVPHDLVFLIGGSAYVGATNFCIDCRLRNGSTVKPPFW